MPTPKAAATFCNISPFLIRLTTSNFRSVVITTRFVQPTLFAITVRQMLQLHCKQHTRQFATRPHSQLLTANWRREAQRCLAAGSSGNRSAWQAFRLSEVRITEVLLYIIVVGGRLTGILIIHLICKFSSHCDLLQRLILISACLSLLENIIFAAVFSATMLMQ
jgi:hypothetical protein